MAIRNIWVVLLGILFTVTACDQRSVEKLHLPRNDTLSVLQAALNDPFMVRQATLYMPEHILTLKQNKNVRPDYKLMFNQRPAKIVDIKEDDVIIRDTYPGQLIIGFPIFKFIDEDTVILSMIIYTGNASNLYKIARNNDDLWEIRSSERGKF